MSVQALSYLVAAIISCALAIATFIRSGRNRLDTAFGFLNGVLFVYYLASFAGGLSPGGLWHRLTLLAALAIPLVALRFFNLFLGQRADLSVRSNRAALVFSALLTPFVISTLVDKLYVKVPVFIFVLISLSWCLALILGRLRRTGSRVDAARLKYLFYGGLAALLLSMSGHLPRIEVWWLPLLGNLTAVVYMYFLHQIILQYRLLDLNELVGKMLVLAVLVTVLAIIYSLFGLFVSHIPSLIFFNAVIAGFVMLIVFEPVNRFVENQINRLLFRERYEFGRQLAALRRELANVIDANQMAERVLMRLENSRRVTAASLYLLEEEGSRLRCLGYLGPPPVDSLDAVTDRAFLDRLEASGALVMESIEAELKGILLPGGDPRLGDIEVCRENIRMMRMLEAGLTVPLVWEEQVVGLLNLADERVRDPFSPEEVAHVVAIANQASICVENWRIVKRIRDRDRLVAIGEMAAGLAHEVRNPLGAIKGAAQMLTESADPADPEDKREFVEIIVEEVNRLNKVLSAFLDYARPFDGMVEPTEVNPVIERVATLLAGPAEEAGVRIELDLTSGLPPAAIYPDVLRQVLWNLGLNAIQAMEPQGGGTVTLRTRSGSRATRAHSGYFGHESVEIGVSDTGPGISDSDLDKIFIPFFTTKPSGTGLGLSICQRLIRAAGGSILVATEPGRGATFTIHLPPWRDDASAGNPTPSP